MVYLFIIGIIIFLLAYFKISYKIMILIYLSLMFFGIYLALNLEKLQTNEGFQINQLNLIKTNLVETDSVSYIVVDDIILVKMDDKQLLYLPIDSTTFIKSDSNYLKIYYNELNDFWKYVLFSHKTPFKYEIFIKE